VLLVLCTQVKVYVCDVDTLRDHITQTQTYTFIWVHNTRNRKIQDRKNTLISKKQNWVLKEQNQNITHSNRLDLVAQLVELFYKIYYGRILVWKWLCKCDFCSNSKRVNMAPNWAAFIGATVSQCIGELGGRCMPERNVASLSNYFRKVKFSFTF
jgi:hypothetical protein